MRSWIFLNRKRWGVGDISIQQELEMLQFYSAQMAQALQTFDKTQGINHSLDFYIVAIKYDFIIQMELGYYREGFDILFNSKKDCN
jgi:hypothetical protein